jgi:hypothetical protein
MKTSKLSKFFGAGLLAVSLASLPVTLPTAAQATTTTTDPVNTTGTTTRTVQQEERDTFDWGWLGLLGLIGLAGLFGRNKNEESVRYREPDEASRPGTRY